MSHAPSYLVLARKYRPRRLDEIVGQEVTTGTLRGAIEEGRVGHAYLFAGPRGTGKTTTARAFAKALNCERGPTPLACGACERCLAADAGADPDTIEIDAASHTGVDHVRELREQVAYMPMRARFKVYIIDEVHMLSRPAFNALLKTLEEPPPHVKFFLATTELHKVPDTIRSRCQVLRLELLPEPVIGARLQQVFALERVEPEAGVTEELARRARGSLRDALSLADQLLALAGERPQLADIERLASEGGGREVERLLERVEAGDKAGALSALPALHGTANAFLELVLDEVRAGLGAALGAPSDAQVAGWAARVGAARLELWLEELLLARQRMDALPGHARVLLESALLRLCDRAATIPLAELVERLAALEARVGGAGAAAAAAPATRPAPAPSPAPRASSAAPAAASPAAAPSAKAEPSAKAGPRTEEPRREPEPRTAAESSAAPAAAGARGASASGGRRQARAGDTWSQFLELLAQRAPSVADVLRSRGKLVENVPGRAVVKLARLRDEERALALEPRNVRACSKAFSEATGQETEVVLEDVASTPPGHTDGYTRQVADLFGGRIEDQA